LIRTLHIPITGRGADILKARTGLGALFLARIAFCPGFRLIGAVGAMWFFVTDFVQFYALATILTLKEARAFAVVTSGRIFILPIITFYVTIALVMFFAQASNLTLISALELGWIAALV
jgi:hypothetical protein